MNKRILFVVIICTICCLYVSLSLTHYEEITLDKEEVCREEYLKDFEIKDGKLISLSNDPWVYKQFEKNINIFAFNVVVNDVDSLGGKCHFFNTENWNSIEHTLKIGNNYLLAESHLGKWKTNEVRFDFVEVENAWLDVDKVIVNPKSLITVLLTMRYFCWVFIVCVVYKFIIWMIEGYYLYYNKQIKNILKNIFTILFALICSEYLIIYLRITENIAINFVISMILILIFRLKVKNIGKRSLFWILVYSAILSISNIVGYHIIVGSNYYGGLITENYILPCNANDIIAFTLLCAIFAKTILVLKECLTKKFLNIQTDENYYIVNTKQVVLVAAFIFISWLPYFLVYYPGFILPDSLSSIYQALGAPLNNHHPIMYSLFIKLCLYFGMVAKDITFGCALYTMIQMMYIAYCLGYMICWLKQRKVNSNVCYLLVAAYSFIPFIAQNSIAMWKDPIFSATILLISLKLYDYVVTRGSIIEKEKNYLLKLIILMIVLCFSRNNGIYILLFSQIVIFLCSILYLKKVYFKKWKLLNFSTLSVILLTFFVTGPIYSALNISDEPVESLGIFVNQMARVAAYDGEMNEDDVAFMDNLLPIEQYKEKYRPCVVDLLKWDENFNGDFLNDHLSDFIKTYFSLLVKNPKIYLEAWELNTYGYWVPNRWELYSDANNICKGDPETFYVWDHKNIEPTNLLSNIDIDWENIIKNTGTTIYLADINWLVFGILFLIIIKKNWKYAIVIAPTIGLIVTLLIATPYMYWQRYGLAEYYLLPVYIYMMIVIAKGGQDVNGKDSNTNTLLQ